MTGAAILVSRGMRVSQAAPAAYPFRSAARVEFRRYRVMGINVQLRTESGEVLVEVYDPRMVLSQAAHREFSNSRLLRYLMPYGDAIFNQAQAGDLMNDIAKLKSDYPETPLSKLLLEIEPFVERLGNGSHLYLWFVGD